MTKRIYEQEVSRILNEYCSEKKTGISRHCYYEIPRFRKQRGCSKTRDLWHNQCKIPASSKSTKTSEMDFPRVVVRRYVSEGSRT